MVIQSTRSGPMVRLLVLAAVFVSSSGFLARNRTTPVQNATTPMQNATMVIKTNDMPESAAEPSDERFPTDWMNPQNVMKYNIDSDPASQRIDSTEAQTKAHRNLNQKQVVFSQVGKHKTANELLYITDSP